jgi:STE24 endopeptidase
VLFRSEKKYGFATITLRLWITDFLKGLLIETLLMAMLLASLLFLMQEAPRTWWLWVWLLFLLFQLLLVWLYPVLIAPLFNKYEPLPDSDLRDSLIALMARAGLDVKGVYRMDAGKRSRHTNAYFTGLGKTKRIVLYDTLLASHEPDEILAVLAHEIGHRQKKHILKQLLSLGTASLIMVYLSWHLLSEPLLYHAFGLAAAAPYAGLFLLAVIFEPLAFFLKPLGMAMLRKFEREADDFSYELLGTSLPLCNALKRLAKDNLANLHPHPFYVWFHYSHPPLEERIARLQRRKETRNPPQNFINA